MSVQPATNISVRYSLELGRLVPLSLYSAGNIGLITGEADSALATGLVGIFLVFGLATAFKKETHGDTTREAIMGVI